MEKINTKVLMTSDQYVVQELLETKRELQLAQKKIEETEDEVDTYKSHYEVLLGLCEIIADNLELKRSDCGSDLINVFLDNNYLGNFWESDLNKQEENATIKTLVELARLVKAIPQGAN